MLGNELMMMTLTYDEVGSLAVYPAFNYAETVDVRGQNKLYVFNNLLDFFAKVRPLNLSTGTGGKRQRQLPLLPFSSRGKRSPFNLKYAL